MGRTDFVLPDTQSRSNGTVIRQRVLQSVVLPSSVTRALLRNWKSIPIVSDPCQHSMTSVALGMDGGRGLGAKEMCDWVFPRA